MTDPVDLETRATERDHLSLRLWLRLLSCTNLVQTRTRTSLRNDFATTLARFDLLAQLERAKAGLPMNELSKRLMVTGGNVTRLTDQLVAEGLVVREPAAHDRRVNEIRLTAAGRRAFAAMATAHEEWIVGMFGTLTHKERTQLYALLAKFKRGLIRREEAER